MTEANARPKPRGIRQSMTELHLWAGLLVGWVLYAMFLTGTVSYFREEISAWMRPELPATAYQNDVSIVAQRMVDAMAGEHAPDAALWSIGLPTSRNPTVTAFWRGHGPSGFASGIFDAATGRRLVARDTRGGDFFYVFHFTLHYVPVLWGRLIAGFCAMFMLVAIVSGVIMHKKIFADFFTFRWGKGQRAWMDAHAALSVLGLPFHFMITYSGLVTLMVLYMPWGLLAMPPPADRAAVTDEMRFFLQPGKPAGKPAPLVSVEALVRQAEERWGIGGVGRMQVNYPGDAHAQVAIERQQSQRVSTTPQYLLFDGVSGNLLRAKENSGPAATTQGMLYGLHMGRFADTVTRWLYFLVSLAGTAMVGTGLVLWTVKRRNRLADPARPYLGFRLVERLNIAAIAGLPLAMTAFLWGNRLLPIGMAGRADWEIHLFFVVWALTLGYAAVRPPKRAWIELFQTTAVALALLLLLNMLTTTRGLVTSLAAGDWVFAGFDLAMLAFAALVALLARKIAHHKSWPAKRRARPPVATEVEA